MQKNQAPKRRPPAKVKLPLWFVGLLSLFLVAVVVASSIWLFRLVFNIASTTTAETTEFTEPDIAPAEATRLAEAGMPMPSIINIGGNNEEGSGDLSIPVISSDLQAWQGVERVNILLMGTDKPCESIDDPQRTDTLMIVSIDPLSKSVAVMSVPRDLWVEIPDGFGSDRINKAHYLGQIHNYPGGGPGLAVKTVEATIGVNLKYYIAIDYNAFVEFVDFIGGIEIDVPEAIVDDSYPDACFGYDPFAVDVGLQTLDGSTALKYARTRATQGADFDRSSRQQLVGLSIRDSMLSANKLPTLIAGAPKLWVDLQEEVNTNLSLDEIVQLALLARDIPRENVRTAVIDFNYVYNETTPRGEQVLVPRRDAIRALRDDLFSAPSAPTREPQDLLATMATENASVAVWNGTTTFGLAADSQTYLNTQNVTVAEIGNADRGDYRSTRVIDYGDNPATTAYITQLMNLPSTSVSYADAAAKPTDGDYDILIILGADWEIP